MILQAVESLLTEKLGFFGDLLSGIFSALWGVATYFAIPVVVTEDVGPIRAIKRSSALLRRIWGEPWPAQADSVRSRKALRIRR